MNNHFDNLMLGVHRLLCMFIGIGLTVALIIVGGR